MASPAEKLDSQGYLTLAEFVEYLQKNYPEMAIAYPTAAKMIQRGELRAMKVGRVNRIMRSEVRRYLQNGNYGGGDSSPSPPLLSSPVIEAKPLDVSKYNDDDWQRKRR